MNLVKRWGPWLTICLLAAGWVLSLRSTRPELLADSDTRVLLYALHREPNPWVWFARDWPLENHFYRPVSTLSFWLDYQTRVAPRLPAGRLSEAEFMAALARIAPEAAPGFGWTNAWLCALCVVLSFWLVRELSEIPWHAAGASLLFASWHGGGIAWLASVIVVLSWSSWLGLARGAGKWRDVLPAWLGGLFLAATLGPTSSFGQHAERWIPGRTATVMTAACLCAMAAFCRWARLSWSRRVRPMRADSTPSTRMSVQTAPSRFSFLWLVASSVAVALALGSYEQAVMLPIVLLGCALILFAKDLRPRWWGLAPAFVLLFAYAALRFLVVPAGSSAYQEQQLRPTASALRSLAELVLPGSSETSPIFIGLGVGWEIVLTATFWASVILLVGNVAFWWLIWKDRRRFETLGWFGVSILAFLPLAWVQQVFGHYHYWSSALFAGFWVLAIAAFLGGWATAISPPEFRAPPRPGPAPGSLPRR